MNNPPAASPDPRIVRLQNTRLSFPQLFQPKAFSDGKGKPNFSATFLLDKKANAAEIAAIRAAIAFVVKEDAKGKTPGPDRLCLQDGSKKPDVDGYGPEIMYVSARNEKRPGVVILYVFPLLSLAAGTAIEPPTCGSSTPGGMPRAKNPAIMLKTSR